MASTSSEISKTEYDVFLSFRGPDTRQGFTDVLYDHLIDTGIRVFRDDDELAIGDTIQLILEAINNSKICVPIFSKSFASSAWCLREVAKMVELNKDIVPIFYDVAPDDVKLKTPLYVDQMKEQQHGKGKAQLEDEWEKALVQVGRIKGHELNKTGFAEFSKKFRAEVLLKLRVNQKYTIKHFVEMPDEVAEALKLLQMESVDVRFLGMYGMGGVGKTALAKIIFNQISSSFDSCSFLANIREERSSKGVDYLRTKLLQDLNPKGVTNNTNFRMKTILIVLDDVGDKSHIEELVGDSISFGSKSRIIITTRDERALIMNVAEALSSITKIEVKGMNPEQGMQLFSRHAFGKDYPPEDYKKLSKDVISICGGLPLALEVIGSLLYGMSVEAWEHKVSKLKTIPAYDVREKLMISYNALEKDVKEIFLDIACFFIGEEKSYPIYMWEACGFGPNWGVQVLIAMSLVKITEDGKFWMHDQLRDLGREIVRIKGFNSPPSREGSRIQTYEDALSIQKINKEKEVVGLHLHGNDDRLTDFANFESLRFLRVTEDVSFHHRNFRQLSTNLTWLSMKLNNRRLTAAFKRVFYGFFQYWDNSYLAKLAVLDLSESAITDNWEGWILIQELRRLKVLDLTGCKKLTRTPNFSKMKALEKLIFCECSRLAKIDSSIGKLRKLKYLNLESCFKLNEFPEEVGSLEDVEQIIMTHTRVSKLPGSIGKLKNLEHLDLSHSYNLEKLPESIGDLSSLVHLDIIWVTVEELPTTIGLLVKLKHLTLLGCYYLYKLPDSIGDLTSLVSLDLSGCYMIKELPSSITRLKKLERLSLSGCERLLKLPSDLGKLELLVELDLPGCVSVLPKTIAQLSLLKKLDLSGCKHSERVPELPTSLTELKFNVRSLIQVPDLSKLSQLRTLSLTDFWEGVDDIWSGVDEPFFKSNAMLARVEVLELHLLNYTCLPVEFGALTQLKSLKISAGSNLTCIPPFPSSIQSLCLSLGSATKLPCLSNLNNLSQLVISYCTMEVLSDLSTLKSLEALVLYFCTGLVEIPGLGSLVSLTTLEIERCDSLKSLENIKNLTNLTSVDIKDCKNLKAIKGLEELEVLRVKINGCKCKDISRYKNYY